MNRAALFPALLALASCGYVGDTQPPSLHIPQRITDLAAEQRSDRVFLRFTLPALTTDGVPIRVFNEVEVIAGDARVPVPPAKPGPVELSVDAGGWAGQEIAIRVRAQSLRGRWSEAVGTTLRVEGPVPTPQALQAVAVAGGVQLSWESAERSFRILRKAPGEEAGKVLAESSTAGFTDRTTEYGKRYEYSVTAQRGQASSEATAPVSVVPADTFAPASPSRLEAVAGLDTVELAWEPPADSDLAGYFVYRAEGSAEFQRLGGRIGTPSFSDKNARPGIRYRYAVSSVDQSGNESERSQPVVITLP